MDPSWDWLIKHLFSKFVDQSPIGSIIPNILGGSSHLVSGLVHPSDFSGLTLQKSHVNHWGELTHLRAVGSSPPSIIPNTLWIFNIAMENSP